MTLAVGGTLNTNTTTSLSLYILTDVVDIQKAPLVPTPVLNKTLKCIALQYCASSINTSVSGLLLVTMVVLALGSDVLILLDFLFNVKAAPHECVIRAGQP